MLNPASGGSGPVNYRVAFLSPVSFFKGGAERSLFDLMANPNVDPLLVVPAEGPVSEQAASRGIPVEVVDFGQVAAIRRPVRPSSVGAAFGDWFGAARKLMAVTKRHGADIVHSNGLKAHCIAGLARKLGGEACVFHVRDIAVRGSERLIWKGLARSSDHTVLVSRACWPGEALPGNVSVVFNGVKRSDVPQLPSGSLSEATRPRGAGTSLVVGICGRIHPFKGHHVAIDWLGAAHRRGLPITLLVRGEAEEEDRPYLDSLKRQADALGLKDFVRFEGRFEGLAAIYNGLDAVLVPSETPDPLPRSVMEAMSMGLPVVGYPAGGIVEMIDHRENGWLAGDAEAFCAAMEEISSLGPMLVELQKSAARTVAERFGMERMHRQVNDVYSAVLGR